MIRCAVRGSHTLGARHRLPSTRTDWPGSIPQVTIGAASRASRPHFVVAPGAPGSEARLAHHVRAAARGPWLTVRTGDPRGVAERRRRPRLM